jgi:hypothetical protein
MPQESAETPLHATLSVDGPLVCEGVSPSIVSIGQQEGNGASIRRRRTTLLPVTSVSEWRR